MMSVFAALIGAVSASHSQAPLVPLYQSGEVIANQYIVALHDDVDVSMFRTIARDFGADRTMDFGKIKAFSGYFREEQLTKLRSLGDYVKFVEQDQVVYTLHETQNNATWSLDRTDQRDLPLDDIYRYPTSAGEGVDVFVIDTGINHNHVDFEGRAINGYNFHDNTENAEDDNGHGTHCAGTVGGAEWGIAKKANLISVKTLGRFGAGNLANVAAGVLFAAESHNEAPGKRTIASMSLGGGVSAIMDNAVEAAIEAGVTVVVASGNNNGNACNNSPARVPDAITVNASDRNDNRAVFSNWGECTDIFAPGVDVTSAWIGSETATITISGTSMACPAVAGLSAILLGEEGPMSPADVKATILANASQDKIANANGSPNLLAYGPF